MNILFMPSNIQTNVEPGTTLLEAIRQAGLVVESPCGGTRQCRKCKVQVTKGNTGEYSREELESLSDSQRNQGMRLACCMKIVEDTCVILSENNAELEECRSSCLVKPAAVDHPLGLAIDIGTTTIEYVVVSLDEGTKIVKGHYYNPGRKYGADVVSRITYCLKNPGNTKKMQQELLTSIEHQVKESLDSIGIGLTNICKVVIVANTTMCHIVTGHTPDKLARAPFQPDYRGGSLQQVNELGLHLSSEATVEVLPIIGGHLGADTVGCLTALQFNKLEGNHLLVDIGTNGEIVIKCKSGLLACSTAAGPAFEGASMTYGMCAGPGAIIRVHMNEGTLKLQVEGGVRPTGISGSGVIDAVAMLLKAGIMDKTGYLLEEYCDCDPVSGNVGYCLYQDTENKIFLTRQDIRQLQLAKAAISAGINTLLMKANLTVQQLDGIWVAGAFGTHLNLENAISIGLLPRVDLSHYHQVGNAALCGAILRLTEQCTRETVRQNTEHIEHIELANMESFQQIFLDEMAF